MKEAGMAFIGLGGVELLYCADEYNASRTNERAVEIPVAIHWISPQEGLGLEVGNVLSHYMPRLWTCVDAFERGPGVLNVDILDFEPDERYDWIVSISTVEHIGWEGRGPDEDADVSKSLWAIEHMRSLLAPGGRMLLSFPTGIHPGLDEAAGSGAFNAESEVFMLRTDDATERCPGSWAPAEFRAELYRSEAWSAGGVWIGVLA